MYIIKDLIIYYKEMKNIVYGDVICDGPNNEEMIVMDIFSIDNKMIYTLVPLRCYKSDANYHDNTIYKTVDVDNNVRYE